MNISILFSSHSILYEFSDQRILTRSSPSARHPTFEHWLKNMGQKKQKRYSLVLDLQLRVCAEAHLPGANLPVHPHLRKASGVDCLQRRRHPHYQAKDRGEPGTPPSQAQIHGKPGVPHLHQHRFPHHEKLTLLSFLLHLRPQPINSQLAPTPSKTGSEPRTGKKLVLMKMR